MELLQSVVTMALARSSRTSYSSNVTSRSTVSDDMDVGGDPEARITKIRHYQVYRGMSPVTTNRMEVRHGHCFTYTLL